jgi:hypothetical protein
VAAGAVGAGWEIFEVVWNCGEAAGLALLDHADVFGAADVVMG